MTTVPTGVPEIDTALGGGFPEGFVILWDTTGVSNRLFRQAGCLFATGRTVTELLTELSGESILICEDAYLFDPTSFATSLRAGLKPNQTVVFILGHGSVTWLRIADGYYAVGGDGIWTPMKERNGNTTPFKVDVAPIIPPVPLLIPTGLPGLDLALGGGLPHGLVYVRGNRPSIKKVRAAMVAVQGGFTTSIHPRPGGLDTGVRQIMANTRVADLKESLILDVGDMTDAFSYPTEGYETTLISVKTLMSRLHDHILGIIKPTCVFFEAHTDALIRPCLIDAADVVLTATNEGPWLVHKPYGKPPVSNWRDATEFDPLWTPPPVKQPVTPERIIDALVRDPELLLAVARKLKVLEPWQLGQTLGRDSWTRSDPVVGFTVAEVMELGGWLWQVTSRRNGALSYTDNPHSVPTASESKAACDAHLRSLGWILLD